jgi:hypothetical protein
MAQNPEAIFETLKTLINPEARSRLLAKGLARGMVWSNGLVPQGGPEFPEDLTADLLDFGYGILALTLELKETNERRDDVDQFDLTESFKVAAESIESAVRRGDPDDVDQGRHLVMCATAFHLAGYAARSYSILPKTTLEKNLSSPERALGFLLRRDLVSLRELIIHWVSNPKNSDDNLAELLKTEENDFGPEDAAFIVLTTLYFKALGKFDSSLLLGDVALCKSCVDDLEKILNCTKEWGNVSLWWVVALSRQMIRDMWGQSLHARLPIGKSDLPSEWQGLRKDFIALLSTRHPPHIDLWPSQLTAAERAVDPQDDLVIALPTSAGKTRIAELCILRTLADKKRIIYVTPLRALSAQVERVLARTFVPLGFSVSSLYGTTGTTKMDSKALEGSNIVVSTPEKLDFAIRQNSEFLDDIGLIVFDEGHMIGLGSREIRYEVLIQRLLRRRDADQRRIVCLSAMFNPDDKYFQDFGNWLRNDKAGEFVHVRWRPTRQRLATLDWRDSSGTAYLEFLEGEKAFVPRFFERVDAKGRRKYPFPTNEIEFCIAAANSFARDGHSILIYSPQRTQIDPVVREFCKISKQRYLSNISHPEKERIRNALTIGKEWLGEKNHAVKALAIGIGTHHGALPRPFLGAIETLLHEKLLPVVVASPTLAQGVDLSCSVLIFRSLTRYSPDEEKQIPIFANEFANVVGRAGRAYVDLDGITVLPSFEGGRKRKDKRVQFEKLIEDSRKLRLISGLARLVMELVKICADKLKVDRKDFAEYILNNQAFWTNPSLQATENESGDEESFSRTLEEYIADLDIALLSLIDPLDIDSGQLESTLDKVLTSSLWERTLKHAPENIFKVEKTVLLSRAKWIWDNTSPTQRRACYYSGLGSKPGIFLHGNLKTLLELLRNLNRAMKTGDSDALAENAIKFVEQTMVDPFFCMSRLPMDWKDALAKWLKGVAFADILSGHKAREQQRIQAFIQEGIIFKILWAAEAVRVQAAAEDKEQVKDIEDGAFLAFSYGVPSIQAALLCQAGFPSRVGALWVTRELDADFVDDYGLMAWLNANSHFLSSSDFWDDEDHFLLWDEFTKPTATSYPTRWKREKMFVGADWIGEPPEKGTRVRLFHHRNQIAQICSLDLTGLGFVNLRFDPRNAFVEGTVAEKGLLEINYFGP